MAQFAQHAVQHLGARGGVAEGGRNAQHLEFRAGQGQPQGKGIVDIVADIAVDDDLFAWGLRLTASGVSSNRAAARADSF